MRILVINAGSTSLKFDVVDTDLAQERPRHNQALRGAVVGIGGEPRLHAEAHGAAEARPDLDDHGSAARAVVAWLTERGAFTGDGIDAMAHRIVHGGPRLFEPVVVTEPVWRELEAASELAPLHNAAALKAVQAAHGSIPDLPIVAVFDTAFFTDLPDISMFYAIPRAIADEHGIRRFGFHGIAHRFMAERASLMLGDESAHRVITLQLGGGCSAAAVLGGRPIDTTMGLTPLEGLVMATRCGDVDSSVVALLARRGVMTPAEAERWLNRECGLLGVSGTSGDARELLRHEAWGHAGASLAIRMFCARVRKCIGAYMSALGGADVLVFGGGIGEHSADIRGRICCGMEWCGLRIDERRNESAVGVEQRISHDDSGVAVYVTPVQEAALIAADAEACLRRSATDRTDSHVEKKEHP